MIFSFSGAQSTGKTTLLNKFHNDYPNDFYFIPEVTRYVKKEYNLPINESGSDLTQQLICLEHLRNAYRKYTKNAILDRCSLDGLVYTRWLYEKDQVERPTLLLAQDIFNKTISRYDVIMYTSPDEVPIVDDGERSIDVNFRNGIIDWFDHYITYIPTSKIVKIKGTVEERVKQIKNILWKN